MVNFTMQTSLIPSVELLLRSSIFCTALTGIVGLMVGSFLNVVIYRLPIMMRHHWRRECLAYLELDAEAVTPPFNLALPLSQCPQCHTGIKPLHNIPLLSYLMLRGQCASCQHPISIRYPLVEGLTALMSMLVAWHFGYAPQTLFALWLTWTLIALSFIDIDEHLLPDSITLPMLWLGLILSLFGFFTDASTSITGAAAGYLVLWTVYHVFKLLTGKEGMGFGDFKLLALFGAWLGWQSLPAIILFSSLVGSIIGVTLIGLNKHDASNPIPFGPYLAVSGWIVLLWGQDINQFYLSYSGL